jgi:hypothetical protein
MDNSNTWHQEAMGKGLYESLDAKLVQRETADWHRDKLVREIIRLRQVWRIDVGNLVKQRNDLQKQLKEKS